MAPQSQDTRSPELQTIKARSIVDDLNGANFARSHRWHFNRTATVSVQIGDVGPFTTTTKELCVADGLGPDTDFDVGSTDEAVTTASGTTIDKATKDEYTVAIKGTDANGESNILTLTVKVGDCSGKEKMAAALGSLLLSLLAFTILSLCNSPRHFKSPKCSRVPALFKLYMLVDSIAGSQEFLFEMSPSVVTPLSSLTVKAGESAVFICRICGRPYPYRHMDV
ncbi:hypothetical protein MAR_036010 [Mya arenaria]|uniref:Uncharacterized protein n=1 Tax=Mya arenaria TaxID=6604 RepID=A0ABY7EPA4_MYAAR|nr:hypothetical protein MAR_036010 [Mya arenaria]